MTAPRLEDLTQPAKRRRRLRDLKQVPVLPSLITLGNVFFGFLAMAKIADAALAAAAGAPISVILDYFEMASILVFVAMVLDAVDGRVARLTGQTTPFGAQLDSMADMVTFGVAPAFMAKVLIEFHVGNLGGSLLPPHPKLYYVAAAIYVLCAALRLARFNVETGPQEEDHREFRGLPSPAAAALVCAMIAFYCTRDDSKEVLSLSRMLLGPEHYDWIILAMPMGLVAAGLLMVSRLPYPHLVYTIVRRRHSFPFLASLVVVIGIAAVEWQFALAVSILGYVCWGMVLGAYRILTRRDLDLGDDDDEDPGGRPQTHDPMLN